MVAPPALAAGSSASARATQHQGLTTGNRWRSRSGAGAPGRLIRARGGGCPLADVGGVHGGSSARARKWLVCSSAVPFRLRVIRACAEVAIPPASCSDGSAGHPRARNWLESLGRVSGLERVIRARAEVASPSIPTGWPNTGHPRERKVALPSGLSGPLRWGYPRARGSGYSSLSGVSSELGLSARARKWLGGQRFPPRRCAGHPRARGGSGPSSGGPSQAKGGSSARAEVARTMSSAAASRRGPPLKPNRRRQRSARARTSLCR